MSTTSALEGTSLIVVGNGAHLTGAPLSLLNILRHKPASVTLRVVLVGEGPLVSHYQEVADELTLLPVPQTPGVGPRRLGEELRLATRLFRATRRRHAREALLVNTVEFEAALARALWWPGRCCIAIREWTSYLKGPRGRLRGLLLRRNRRARLACVGDAQAEEWSRALGRPVERLVNVYEDPPVVGGAPSGPAPGPVRFLVVGNRSTNKGVDLALAAYDRMTHKDRCELRVAGGDFPPGSANGVRWLGEVADLGSRMAEFGDVLLGTSRRESFSRSTIEAALAGVPLLAWNTSGYTEQLRTLGGWGVEPFDVDAFAAEMDRIVARGRDELLRLGPQVRQAALEAYDPRTAADAWWSWLVGSP